MSRVGRTFTLALLSLSIARGSVQARQETPIPEPEPCSLSMRLMMECDESDAAVVFGAAGVVAVAALLFKLGWKTRDSE